MDLWDFSSCITFNIDMEYWEC